ncbi:tail fiber domain-containing protein [Bacillus cereus]|uniref:phage tail spike protein n=1 Tax=Bacillus cereus TaxID=1396 RepID=UPI002AC20B14|nr:phage tail spike protein [Bacillus cereus]MDZ4453201.1 tail fiber domain-containing protein [Bacillus cereus]
MSTPSGDLHVVDFKTNQIVSAIQPKDYWDDKRHWEIKNNIDTLEFRVFENTDQAATLVQQNLVLKEVRGGRIVPYVITETEKDSKDRSLMVYASGEWIQLAKAGIIEPQKIESKTLKQCMEIALKGTKWKIGKTEHDGAHSMVIEEFTDPLDLLKKIAASFELEIQYRAEVVGSKIVGRYVDMVKRRGRDTRKEVTFGKDLIGIKRIENSQNICTALLGFVKKENGEFITISSINKGVPYLVDDAAYQRWNENGKHKFAFYTPQTDDQNMSPERLLTLMKTEMSKLVNASVSYGVDAQNIARVPGLSHEEINEGDTIRIIDEGFTPKLYLEARAIAGDESFKDPTQDNYVFGDYREIVDQNDELRRLYQKILSSLYDKVPQELFDQLNNKVKEQNKDIIDAKDKADQAQKESQTAKDLAETTQKYIEQNMVDIIEQPTAPTENLRDGKTLWIDSSDPENKVQKLWKSGQWQRVTPDTGPLKQSIKDVKEDIETAKTELNQKVQGVEGKAQEIAGQIVDVQKQVNGKVDQTWINTQLKDKADKSGVFTKEEINNGFIGKQVYETDKQGNIKKFQEISTSFEQTNEAIKSKAEKQSVTDLGNNLSQVSKVANEAKQTAEGNINTITSLQATVNKINDDVTNLLIDSGTFEGAINANFPERWYLKGGGAKISVDIFKGSAVFETQSSWSGIGYNFKDLINRGVLKVGDTVNYSFYARLKGLPAGETRPHVFFFRGSASGTRWTDLNNDWKRYSVTFTINADMMGTSGNVVESFIRTEIEANTGDTVRYQQSQPQLTIGDKLYTWRTAPEDNATIVKKSNEIKQTVDSNISTIQNIQKDQGKLTERMAKSEQTADGFKTSIESLTKKDTEISNKLNTVESTVEGTKQTISDIQQTTSNLTKTTNEIKQTADTNKQTISQLKTDVSNISVGSINLSSGSETGLNKQNVTGTWSDSKQMTLSDKINFRNKTFTISFLFTGKMTKLNSNPWFGVETAITYADGEQEWKSVRADSPLKTNVDYKDEPLSVTFKTKDKDITLIRFYYSGRNIEGNLNSHHAKFEEGNIRTTWQPANEEITSKADFTKTTNEIKQTVDTNSQTISTVQKDQGTMQTTLNQVKQTTDSNSQTITTLSQTQGKQGEIIQQNTSDITQLNNQMKSKVSDTQMQEYVGGLGSTNLLFNAAFDDRVINAATGAVTSRTPSTTKWILVGTGSGITIVPESARHHEGYNSVKITATGQTAGKWSGIMQRVPAVQNGGDHVFSAWVYVQEKNTLDNGGAIKLQFFNGANAVSTFVQTEFKDLLVNNSWVLVSVKITSPNVAVTHLQGDIWVRQNGTIWVSQPQLQQGSARSTFMENPKDYANYDQLVGEIAKKVATSDFNNKVTQMETTINQQSNRIDLKAEATNVYTKTEADGTFGSKAIVESHSSQLSVMSNEISTRIKAGEIASAINQTAQAVLIQARKIYLDGYIEAKHLRAQELVGVTIKTAPQGSNSNHIRLNAQDMTLYGSGANRAYLGFMETTDGSIQPSLVLGSDNIKYRGAGAFYIYQATPRINGFEQPSKAWAKFGISKGENAEGNNIWSSYIQMQNDGGHMDIYADGKLRLKCLNNIEIESEGWTSGAGSFSVTTTEPHAFTNNWGQFTFKRKGSDYKIHFLNGATDHDLIMGNAMIRSSFVQGYNNGLQIKDMMGQGWKDIELRTLYAQEDAIATQNMWAKAFKTTSARNMKENIKDIPFSALDKIMNLAIKQYNFKDDMYDLYQMRVNKPEEKTEPYTTKEIETYFGMIADDTDAIFTDKEKRAINLYNTVSILIAAFQQQYHEFNEGLTTVKGENKQLKEQVATLTNDVSTLTELVQKLINGKLEQP